MPCEERAALRGFARCGAPPRERAYAAWRTNLVHMASTRLVQVRAAPRRSVTIGQRALAVHMRRCFVHALCCAYTERPLTGLCMGRD